MAKPKATSSAPKPVYSAWLMKAEPDSRLEKGKEVKFSVDDFAACQTTSWDGVRNHQAKNFMRDDMKLGHKVLFYHSNTKVPGVYGLAEVCKEGYPDPSAFDASHPYFDPKSSVSSPTWHCVDLSYQAHLAHPATLADLKALHALEPDDDDGRARIGLAYLDEEAHEAIKSMLVVSASRLSVQPVTASAYAAVLLIGERGRQHPEGVDAAGAAVKPKGKGKKRPAAEDEGGREGGEASSEKAGGGKKKPRKTKGGGEEAQ